MGVQTSPQLAIAIAGARSVGLTRKQSGEVIWQMALYGGFPSAINALDIALDVFVEEGAQGQ